MNNRGMTIIEMVLYVAIGSVIFLFISNFTLSILQARSKSIAVSEVDRQGERALLMILQSVRLAQGISGPAVGATSTVLTLTYSSPDINPTVIAFFDGKITIKSGKHAIENLVGPAVNIDNVVFYNASYDGAKGVVRVRLDLSYAGSVNRAAGNYSKSFYGTASLR